MHKQWAHRLHVAMQKCTHTTPKNHNWHNSTNTLVLFSDVPSVIQSATIPCQISHSARRSPVCSFFFCFVVLFRIRFDYFPSNDFYAWNYELLDAVFLILFVRKHCLHNNNQRQYIYIFGMIHIQQPIYALDFYLEMRQRPMQHSREKKNTNDMHNKHIIRITQISL